MNFILLILILLAAITAIVFIAIPKQTSALAPPAQPDSRFAAIMKGGSYQPVLSIQGLNDLATNFVFDNPNGDATDPTGGSVNYAWFMDKNSAITDAANPLQIVPNINGNVFWQNINLTNANVQAANWSDNQDGTFSIRPSPGLVDGGVNVGSFRLGSKNFFKGGLFVFDVVSLPAACGTWPAVWLNGFVGMPNQYRFDPTKNTAKLDKINAMYQKQYTLTDVLMPRNFATSTVDNYAPHQCSSDQVLTSNINSTNPLVSGLDVPMSNYLGKNVYPARWPAQGEIDIIEAVNFNSNSTVSIHTGSFCKPTSSFAFKNNNYQTSANACGNTASTFGNYSGCKNSLNSYGYADSAVDFIDGKSAPVCGDAPGQTQIDTPNGTFGPTFNAGGGGVYVCQWVPEEAIYVWLFPYSRFDKSGMKAAGGPLSSSPMPANSWEAGLVAEFQLAKGPNTGNQAGCDMSYMEIVINLTFGGGWAGQSGIFDCPYSGARTDFATYLRSCYGQANGNCGVPSYASAGPFQYLDMTFSSITVFQNPKTDDMF